MLTVTNAALNHLSTLLLDSSNETMRLYATKEGLALVPDEIKPGDQVHERDGHAILVINESVSLAIGEKTLDVATEAGTARLTIRN